MNDSPEKDRFDEARHILLIKIDNIPLTRDANLQLHKLVGDMGNAFNLVNIKLSALKEKTS